MLLLVVDLMLLNRRRGYNYLLVIVLTIHLITRKNGKRNRLVFFISEMLLVMTVFVLKTNVFMCTVYTTKTKLTHPLVGWYARYDYCVWRTRINVWNPLLNKNEEKNCNAFQGSNRWGEKYKMTNLYWFFFGTV